MSAHDGTTEDDQKPEELETDQAADEDLEETGAPEAAEEEVKEADAEAPVDLAAEMYYERQQVREKRMTLAEANELPTATLGDLARLKEARLEQALPFPLKSIGMKVMVAPCNVPTYMDMLSEVFAAADDGGVQAAAAASMKLVVACMVDPVVENEKELTDMLREGGEEIMGLFAFCRQISGLDDDMEGGIGGAVQMAVDFTAAARLS